MAKADRRCRCCNNNGGICVMMQQSPTTLDTGESFRSQQSLRTPNRLPCNPQRSAGRSNTAIPSLSMSRNLSPVVSVIHYSIVNRSMLNLNYSEESGLKWTLPSRSFLGAASQDDSAHCIKVWTSSFFFSSHDSGGVQSPVAFTSDITFFLDLSGHVWHVEVEKGRCAKFNSLLFLFWVLIFVMDPGVDPDVSYLGGQRLRKRRESLSILYPFKWTLNKGQRLS